MMIMHKKVGESYIEDKKPIIAVMVWIALGWRPGPSPS